MRAAFEAAGGPCPSYSPRDVTNAAAAADCSDDVVLMIFGSEDNRNQTADTLKIFTDLLVGPNWIVNAPRPTIDQVRQDMGGVVYEAQD